MSASSTTYPTTLIFTKMLLILIITLITLVVSVLLVGRYLLADLSRLWLKHSRKVFCGHDEGTYYCELAVMLVLTLVLAVGAVALKGAVVTLVALATTGNLSEYTTALRGTFSFTNEAQLPGKHLVMLLAGPLLKLLATFVLMTSIDAFFRSFNKHFGGDTFFECDSFFFTSIGVLFLVFIELLWHSQNVKAPNASANMAYLVLDKLHYVICFLTLYWQKTLHNSRKQLVAAMDRYIKMSDNEKQIVLSPALMLTLTYLVGMLMSLPYFLGLQWIRSNLALVAVFMVVLGIACLILGKVFSHTWNFMGTIVFDTAMGNSLGNVGLVNRAGSRFNRPIRIALLVAAAAMVALFAGFHLYLFFMFVLTVMFVAVGVAVVALVVYCFVLLVMVITTAFRKRGTYDLSLREMLSYYANTMLSILVALKVPFAVALLAFMLVVTFPKRLNMEHVFTNGSIVDTNGEVLYVDTDHDRYYVPMSYEELPDFFKKALVNQEDRCFFHQHDLMPNKSNWHGLSFAFLKARGGSNLNAQLVKNRTYLQAEGFPRDISRKGADMLGGLMLSETATPEQIMEDYANLASFHGARGFCGVNAAALHAFGQPLGKLNKLQQLYLVNTLPRSVFMSDGKHKVPYTQIQNDSTRMVKDMLLKKAEAWEANGLITKKELNELRRCDLNFTNRPYRSGITPPTRLRLEKEINGKCGRYLSYMTLDNEEALGRAYSQLQTKPAFRKNSSELQIACLVIEVRTGHIVGHYSSGNDYTAYREGFPIGSLGKPAIVTQLLEMGVSPGMELFDGQVGKRKTPKNANHGWSCKNVNITTMLSKSLNAPFANICDVANPRTTFLGVERSYQRMGIEPNEALCEDTYNYPLGNRQMTVEEVANLYQTLLNDGVHIPLRMLETGENIQSERIYEASDVAVVKNALSQTVVSGTMKGYRKQLPQGVTFYSKTGTSSRQQDGWNILSDGDILIVTWASYGRLNGDHLTLGTETLYGASSAGLFSVLAYNELNNHH